jgi:hypothetical protein
VRTTFWANNWQINNDYGAFHLQLQYDQPPGWCVSAARARVRQLRCVHRAPYQRHDR